MTKNESYVSLSIHNLPLETFTKLSAALTDVCENENEERLPGEKWMSGELRLGTRSITFYTEHYKGVKE